MSLFALANKTCFTNYFRQSSTARVISAQAGTITAGSPGDATITLPRLNAIASSSASFAFRITAVIGVPSSSNAPAGNRAVRLLVVIDISLALPLRKSATWRLAGSQRSAKLVALPSPKRAEDAVGPVT